MLKKKFSVAIIGAGRVGTAFALDFNLKNINIEAVIDIDIKKAKKLAQKVNSKIYSTQISDIPPTVNLFAITVQDRFISQVANQLSKISISFKDKYAFHTSGTISSDELKPLTSKGCLVFCIHPNFSFVNNEKNKQHLIKFNNSVFAIESRSKKAIFFAKEFCKRLNYDFIQIKSDHKILYHIFSVLISNYTVTKLYLVEKHLGKKTIKSYLGLLKSTIQNIERFGVKKSLSGPIIRQDLTTIKRHIEVLSQLDDNFKEVYKKLGQMTIDIVEPDLDKSFDVELRKLLQ